MSDWCKGALSLPSSSEGRAARPQLERRCAAAAGVTFWISELIVSVGLAETFTLLGVPCARPGERGQGGRAAARWAQRRWNIPSSGH